MEIRHNICSTTSSDIWFVLSRPSHVTKIYTWLFMNISVHSVQHEKEFSNLSTWKSVFQKLRFRRIKTPSRCGRNSKNLEKKMRFQMCPDSCRYGADSDIPEVPKTLLTLISSVAKRRYIPSDVLRVTARTACTCFVFFEILKRSSWLVSCEAFCDIIISGWNPKRGKISNVHRIQK